MTTEQRKGGILRALEVAAIVFSVITGATSVGILVWKGGQMAQMVDSHEMRLIKIENIGTATLSAHIALDEERDKQSKARMDRLEDVYKVALDMRADIATIRQKVDDLKDRLKP